MTIPRSLSVLVVDDNILLRELVSARLRAGGCTVLEAATGEEAAQALLDGARADMLVTDIAMPGSVSGWCLGERFRALHPDCPIVYTSSGAPDPARMQANSRFVQKPFHPDELVVAIEQLTSGQAVPRGTDKGVSDTVN
jgi:two-component system, OmpR family, response regulator